MFTDCSFDLTKNKLDCYKGEDSMERFCKDLREQGYGPDSQVLSPQLMAWFSLLLLILVCFYSRCCLFFYYYYLLFFSYYILYILFIFSIWDGVGTKDRFFHWGWGMGVEALI